MGTRTENHECKSTIDNGEIRSSDHLSRRHSVNNLTRMCYCSYLILLKFKCRTIYENRVRSYPLCREGKKNPATERTDRRRKGAKGTQLNDATDRPTLCAARATQRTARLKRGKRKSEQSPDENERRRRKKGRNRWIGEEGRRIVELGRGGHGGCAVRVKRGRKEGPRACETDRFGACESDPVRGRERKRGGQNTRIAAHIRQRIMNLMSRSVRDSIHSFYQAK